MARKEMEQLRTWLDDAYAMETGLVGILQTQASHFADMAHVAKRLHQHAAETQQHAKRVERCLNLLGAQPSGVKSTLSSLAATVEGMSTAIFSDQLTKDALMEYASEQFEVACYTALISRARALGEVEIATLCEENLREDRAMADWLLQQLPVVASVDSRSAA
jgi:ferritin-like metal-binding protein YciE